jgi:zinc transport system substrate-binding protein
MLKVFSILFGFIIFLILALFIYPFYNPSENLENGGKARVSVTIYPTYDIVKNIAGDLIDFQQIIPFGQEPHSFEPTPKDIMRISNSQLFIYTGEHVDMWASELADTSKNDKFLRLSESVKVVNNDPHFWLSFENFKIMIKEITANLSNIDPKNSPIFEQNMALYLEKVEKLEDDFRNGLKSCKLDTIIVNHNAFQYLGREFNFKSVSIMGLSPDDKPSAKVLAEIINNVKEHNISTIFFEELASDSVAKTIAGESGAKISSLSPLGNISPDDVNVGFVPLMYKNLEKLREALDCQ